jgi:glycosyltransferase involved in cell wall biosynthesis
MSRHRLLCVAYHFPPVGGAGVQRTVKFLRHLPDLGFQPVVITGPIGSAGDDFLEDPTMLAELPPDLEVIRIPGPEPGETGGWRGRGERWLRLESQWTRWWTRGVEAAGRSVNDVSAIYASMSPFQSSAPASALSRLRRIPWIADLRDPWALDEMRVYPSRLHRRLELQAMRDALASAAGIVMNTPEAEIQLLRSFPELAQRRVVTITNGWDAADFEGPPPPREDGAFRIVHVGTLHTDYGRRHRGQRVLRRLLGGTIGDVDILTRSHVFLVQAIERLLLSDPSLADVLEIHLAGGLTDADRHEIDLPFVRAHGYLDHMASVRLVRSADLLFLPMHDLPEGRRARIVPGKTYEYLAAGCPILGAIPDGDARDLLSWAGNAYLCRPSDVACMAEAIVSELARKREAARPTEPDRQVVNAYERRRLAEQLATLLRTILGDRRRGPAPRGSPCNRIDD